MASTQTPSRKKAKDAKLNELTDPPAASGFGLDGEVVRIKKTLAGGITLSGGGRRIPLPLRRTPLRVALFGDSTANVGLTSVPDTHDTRIVTAPFPPSGANSIGIGSGHKFFLPAKYPMAYLVASCGVSGEGTAAMLARDGAAYSTMRKAIQDALDQSPDVFIYRGASINDLGAVTSSTWQATADATFVRHQQIVERMLTGGVPVIDWGCYGYSAAAATDPASTRQALLYLNNKIATLPNVYPGKVFYADPQLAGIQAPDGNFYANKTIDGVHLNLPAGIDQGTLESEIVSSIFGASSDVRYPGLNLITNSMFHNTVGGVATGMSFNILNCTASDKKVETIDGHRFNTTVIDITGAGSYAKF